MVRKKVTKKKKVTRKRIPKYEFKVVELGKKGQGKGRKGKYFYVKETKKKPKYYKYKENVKKRDVLEFYKRGIVTKRGGVSKKRLTKERRLDKKERTIKKKYPSIEGTLQKGYAEYTIRNPEKLTPNGIRTSYQYLLMNKDKAGDGHGIVRDKELLELITRSENIEKWKHRVLFEVKVKNERGEILTSITNSNVKSLGELKSEVIDNIKVGQEYESRYDTLSGKLISKGMKREKIEQKGWNINKGTSQSGTIKSIDVKMIFRKA